MFGLVYFYHFHLIVAPASSMARYRDPVFRPSDPSVNPSVRVCISETLRGTSAKLGTNIKRYQAMCIE